MTWEERFSKEDVALVRQVSGEGERMATAALAAQIRINLGNTPEVEKAVGDALEQVWAERRLDTPERGWDPVTDIRSEPIYEHDCSECFFLGGVAGEDIYVCPQHGRPTVVRRYGNAGPEYTSGRREHENLPRELFDLADEKLHEMGAG